MTSHPALKPSLQATPVPSRRLHIYHRSNVQVLSQRDIIHHETWMHFVTTFACVGVITCLALHSGFRDSDTHFGRMPDFASIRHWT